MKDKPIETITKVWGEEIVLKREPYTLKLMRIEPGYKCSLHWHKNKEETFILLTGQVSVTTVDHRTAEHSETKLFKPGESITVKPMTPHTFKALNGKNAVLLECSTVDVASDSYRVFPSGEEDE